ncbi:MAG: hypothetical protein KBD76_15970, partial [Bacteriovorax sp.]|nr:hypothetical protein [Bacteriovorax sp.]
IPSVEQLEHFFQSLTEYDLTPLQNLASIEYGYISRSSDVEILQYGPLVFDENRYLKSVYVGKELLERRALNETTAKILTELGYRKQMGYLMPPQNIAKLYRTIYERLLSSARLSGVDQSEVVFPALRFSRGIVVQFVRPGIDPIPRRVDGWQLLVHAVELPKDQWVQMVQEKKMILGTEMFFHDIGHVVDMIERPHYMKEYRHFVLQKNEVLKALQNKHQWLGAWQKYGPVISRGDIERYLNEFLYLPSEKNSQEIKKLIPHLNLEQPSTREELRDFYEKKDNLKQAILWLKKRYLLFSSHGGAARDWSVNRYLTPKDMNNGFSEILQEEASFYKHVSATEMNQWGFELPGNMDKNYRVFEASDLFLRLQYLVETHGKKEIPNEIKAHLEQLAQEHGEGIDLFIKKMIALHLAEIHYRIQSSLLYKISPEQIAKDTSLLYKNEQGWREYRKSATFKYYSTYPKFSVQWYLGVDVARAAP